MWHESFSNQQRNITTLGWWVQRNVLNKQGWVCLMLNLLWCVSLVFLQLFVLMFAGMNVPHCPSCLSIKAFVRVLLCFLCHVLSPSVSNQVHKATSCPRIQRWFIIQSALWSFHLVFSHPLAFSASKLSFWPYFFLLSLPSTDMTSPNNRTKHLALFFLPECKYGNMINLSFDFYQTTLL